jgi:hypothetical protein
MLDLSQLYLTRLQETCCRGAASASSSSALSGGAIAGIVIGSIVGVALLAVVAIFFVKHQKKQSAEWQHHQEILNTASRSMSNA